MGVKYDPPIVMVPVIITHDSIESEHPSVFLQNGTRLIGKLRLNRFLDELKSKQILGCSNSLYFLYKRIIFQVAGEDLRSVNEVLIAPEKVPA